jgi:hypothetical protein
VADLVDDSDAAKRSRVLGALKDPAQKNNRDHVDIIIALGMAKEGFRLDLVRARADDRLSQQPDRNRADHRPRHARCRGQGAGALHQPDRRAPAEQAAVAEAVNDMLKAISASLLMEQVLAPRYEFTPKQRGPQEGFDYGDEGYKEGGHNLG